MPKEIELTNLTKELLTAKAGEASWKAIRIALEEEITTLIPPSDDKKQETVTLENGTKIVVKRDVAYTANLDGIRDAIVNFSDGQQAVPIKTETVHKLDVKGYEWYRENNNEVFNLISPHVTVKPKKTSVTVKSPER